MELSTINPPPTPLRQPNPNDDDEEEEEGREGESFHRVSMEDSTLSTPPHQSFPDLNPDEGWIVEKNIHPIEQVRMTVDPFDNPTLPVFTIRTWLLGVSSCIMLAFANKFFGYRTNQLSIGPVCVQIVALPIGRFLAAWMPKKDVKIPFTNLSFSLNPGPFSMKEHCLITIFANSGAGGVYSIHIVTIVRAFYHRKINPVVAFLLAQTTQLLGYGWAGIYRKYLVESPYMWWPSNLVQVSLFKALHQKEKRKRGTLSRFQFFIVIFVCSFAYYIIPGYLFPAISAVSTVCLFSKNSVTAQQIGSGMKGLGIGSFGLDWSTVAGFLGSPLETPASTIFNMMVGYFIVIYGILPLAYWTNVYDAKKFPLISSHVYDSAANIYNTSRIINSQSFTLNVAEQESYSKIHMSIMFTLAYGLGFATLTASIMHVFLHDGKDIWKSWRQANNASEEKKADVHMRLMMKYDAVPQWWFYTLLVLVIPLSIFTCVGFGGELQLPWWGILLACAMALFFTLPIGVINATTNQQPGLNIITEYIIGLMLPGKPLANVTFKTYGYISMTQALTFLSDFNLGHYMKIPPKAMFISQLAGTVIAATVYFGTAWFLLETVENICDADKLPAGSPWTCPGDDVFYNASIIWGLVGPVRMFGKLGLYSALNYFFILGFLLPIPFWWISRAYPGQKWLKHIHIPIILGGAGGIPPAHTVNYLTWGFVGVFFNYYVYNKHKQWWARHTYVMSAALDAGVAFMGVLIFFALQYYDVSGIDWIGGNATDFCNLASCPTAPGIVAEGCPVQ